MLRLLLCDLPAQPLTGGFLDGGRNLFGLLDRLSLRGFFGDLFRDCLAVRKDFSEPVAHVLDELSQALHRGKAGQARGACLTHRTHGPEVIAGDHHRRRSFFFQPFFPNETELGQAVAEGLQFDSGLARVRIRNPPGEQIGVIGEDVDAFPATGNGNVKLLAVDGGKRF